MKRKPIDKLVYECMFPRPKLSDPPDFHAILTRYLVFEVRQEVHSFYGHINSQEARYPGLDYCHRIHRIRLSRWPWHRRLFRAFDALRLTPNEIASLTKWEGTKWAKERYEAEQGITIDETSDDDIPDWREPGSRWRAEEDKNSSEGSDTAHPPSSPTGRDQHMSVLVEEEVEEGEVGEGEGNEGSSGPRGSAGNEGDGGRSGGGEAAEAAAEGESAEGGQAGQARQAGQEAAETGSPETAGAGSAAIGENTESTSHNGRGSAGPSQGEDGATRAGGDDGATLASGTIATTSTTSAASTAGTAGTDNIRVNVRIRIGDSNNENEDEESDLEIQSIGLQLNERLFARVAAHHAGDTSLPLDEAWEQWLKNAIETGNLTLVADNIGRLSTLPQPPPAMALSSPTQPAVLSSNITTVRQFADELRQTLYGHNGDSYPTDVTLSRSRPATTTNTRTGSDRFQLTFEDA